MLGYDTVRVFRPVEAVRENAFRTRIETVGGGVDFDDDVVVDGKKVWWVKTARYAHFGRVLVVTVPSLARYYGEGFFKGVGYKGLLDAVGEIGLHYAPGNYRPEDWYIGRLDVKFDYECARAEVRAGLSELRAFYELPRWLKVCYASEQDVKEGRGNTVYFTRGGRRFGVYDKGAEVRTRYDREFKGEGLRVELRYLTSRALRRVAGVKVVKDLEGINPGRVLAKYCGGLREFSGIREDVVEVLKKGCGKRFRVDYAKINALLWGLPADAEAVFGAHLERAGITGERAKRALANFRELARVGARATLGTPLVMPKVIGAITGLGRV